MPNRCHAAPRRCHRGARVTPETSQEPTRVADPRDAIRPLTVVARTHADRVLDTRQTRHGARPLARQTPRASRMTDASELDRTRTDRTVDGHHWPPSWDVGTRSAFRVRAISARERPLVRSRRIRSTSSSAHARPATGRQPRFGSGPRCLDSLGEVPLELRDRESGVLPHSVATVAITGDDATVERGCAVAILGSMCPVRGR